MLIIAIGMVVGRQMVGFGWHRSLVFEMHFTAVLDGTSLKVIRFKDATTGLVCVAIQEVPFESGVPLRSEMPIWLTTNRNNTRIFVLDREVKLGDGSLHVFCCKTSEEIYVGSYSAQNDESIREWMNFGGERKVFIEVLSTGRRYP